LSAAVDAEKDLALGLVSFTEVHYMELVVVALPAQ
jgi:hypothetical protein